jgi:hypothetical protein
MRSTISKPRAILRAVSVVATAVALAAPSVASAQDSAAGRTVVATAATVATERVADQLGAKLANAQPAELAIGTSATGIISNPAGLAALGLRDAKAGARVTIMRSGRDRIRVEVDEFDPVARTRRLALHVDADGRLSVATP